MLQFWKFDYQQLNLHDIMYKKKNQHTHLQALTLCKGYVIGSTHMHAERKQTL